MNAKTKRSFSATAGKPLLRGHGQYVNLRMKQATKMGLEHCDCTSAYQMRSKSNHHERREQAPNDALNQVPDAHQCGARGCEARRRVQGSVKCRERKTGKIYRMEPEIGIGREGKQGLSQSYSSGAPAPRICDSEIRIVGNKQNRVVGGV